MKVYHPGESFGELALLYNAPRSASIVAEKESMLWSLDRMTFNYILKQAMQKKRDNIDLFLDEMEIFNDVDRETKDRIGDSLKDCWYGPGQTIMEVND